MKSNDKQTVTSTAAQQQKLESHAESDSSLWKMQDDAFLFEMWTCNFKHCMCISFLWNANLQWTVEGSVYKMNV